MSSFKLLKVQRDYIDKILNDSIGIKCLILDEETLQIVSLIYAQTDILRKDVFLVENINSSNKDQIKHMKGIYLVRYT